MNESEKNTIKIVVKWVLGFIAFILILSSFGTIGAGERGVKTQFGRVISTIEQGLYFKMPIIQQVHKIDVKTQSVKYEAVDALTSASKDLQDVKVSTVVTYHIDPTKVVDLYTQYQTIAIHEDKVIRPIVRDTVKAITSQYTAEELVTKRAEYSDRVLKLLNERVNGSFAIVEQSNITNLEFSPAFTQAIEAKVTAVQNSETAKNNLEKVKFEQQAQIEIAKAQAEKTRLEAVALASAQGEKLIEKIYAEASLEASKKWNGVLPTQMIPGGTLPFINLTK